MYWSMGVLGKYAGHLFVLFLLLSCFIMGLGGGEGMGGYIYIRITASICLGFAQTLPSELLSCLPARSGLLSVCQQGQGYYLQGQGHSDDEPNKKYVFHVF